MKKQIVNLLLQIIPVMIGVYLGFAVTNWGEQQNRAKQSKIFLNIVEQEIKVNKEKIDRVIDYHRMLRDSARHYLNTNKITIGQPAYFRGIRTQALISSAYNTGNQTGIINELEMVKIQELNLLYRYQEDYNDFSKMILEGLINMDFSDTSESMKHVLRFLSVSMTDLSIKEEALLDSYDKTLLTLRE